MRRKSNNAVSGGQSVAGGHVRVQQLVRNEQNRRQNVASREDRVTVLSQLDQSLLLVRV